MSSSNQDTNINLHFTVAVLFVFFVTGSSRGVELKVEVQAVSQLILSTYLFINQSPRVLHTLIPLPNSTNRFYYDLNHVCTERGPNGSCHQNRWHLSRKNRCSESIDKNMFDVFFFPTHHPNVHHTFNFFEEYITNIYLSVLTNV